VVLTRRGLTRPALALLAAASFAAACGGSDQPRGFSLPTPKPTATVAPSSPPALTTPPATTPAPRGRRGSGKPVTLAFAGDVHFEGASRAALSGGLAAITPTLSAADLTVVNLETAITDRGSPSPKQYNFRAPASAFAALRAAGVDVVSGANNHGLDYGQTGLADTLAAARAARTPALVGLGENADAAFAPFRATIRGQRIAVIGASQVLDDNLKVAWTATDTRPGMASAYEVERLLASTRAARASSDTVVVFLHWGKERETCPIPRQRVLARQLVDAGADVVVGSHAHVLLGTGRLDGAVVSYGLGNFVFYARPGIGAQTGVLAVTITGRDVEEYEWRPAVIERGLPRPLSGVAADRARAAWERLRGCTGLQP
jgi:hypothetical protein